MKGLNLFRGSYLHKSIISRYWSFPNPITLKEIPLTCHTEMLLVSKLSKKIFSDVSTLKADIFRRGTTTGKQ